MQVKYLGSPSLGFNPLQRRTIEPAPGKYSNWTIFKRVLTTTGGSTPVTTETHEVVTDATEIGIDTVGVLMVQPEGVDIVAGDSIDLVAGTIRIDLTAYEAARLDEIKKLGTTTMCDLSTLLTDPVRNQSITGSGCILQLVQVVR